jgi:phage-related protein
MKNLSIKQLEQLAEEIRKDVIYTVSKVRRGGAQAKKGMRRASQDCMWRHAAAGAARQRLLCLREQV